MKIVEIPGGTASLREADEVRQRDRKRVVSAGIAASSAMAKIAEQKRSRGELEEIDMATLGLTFDEGEAFQVLQKAAIVASLAAWSLPGEVPTWETVEDLPTNVYGALEKATQGNLNVILNGTDFAAMDPASPGFEESPTVRSAGSDSGSSADQASESISTRESGGSSTGTAQSSQA